MKKIVYSLMIGIALFFFLLMITTDKSVDFLPGDSNEISVYLL